MTTPRLRLTPLEDRRTPAAIGSLDTRFNVNGTQDIAFDKGGSLADRAAAIAVQSDGRIIVVGSATAGATDIDFAIARLNADGSFDTTFGADKTGKVVVGFDLGGANIDVPTAVTIEAGKILVAGYAQVDASGDYDFAICRLNSDGTLDSTFDDDGRVTIGFDIGGTKEDKAFSIAVDNSSTRLIAVGGTVAQAQAGDTDFGVVLLNPGGSLVGPFSDDGRVVVSFDQGGTNRDSLTALEVDLQNNIVLVGTVEVNDAGDFDVGIARIDAVGELDKEFDTDGRRLVSFDVGGSKADVAAGFAFDQAGNYVVVATVDAGNGDQDVGIARIRTNGADDTTFGTKGQVLLGFDQGGTNRDQAAGVVVDSLGLILVAATVETKSGGDTDVGVARLNADGTLDGRFDVDGRSIVAFDRGGNNGDVAAAIALQSNQQPVILATVITKQANDTDLAVARLVAGSSLGNEIAISGPTNGLAKTFVQTTGTFTPDATFDALSISSVRAVTADINGDRILDTVLGVGPGGGSFVTVFLSAPPGSDPTNPQPPIQFSAFESSFKGGVFVAAGDIDGDGRAELAVSPDVGGGGRATVYSLNQFSRTLDKRVDFFGIDDPNFRGGARVAMGDVNNDGRADLLVGAGFLGGPRVALYDGAAIANGTPGKLINDFFAFPGTDSERLRNGVFVSIGDLNGDGFGELIFGGGPGGGPRVLALDGQQITAKNLTAAFAKPATNFFVANDTNSRGGVRLAVVDADGDSFADLVTASGDNQPSRVRIYRGSSIASQQSGFEPLIVQELDPFGAIVPGGVFVG